MASASTSLDMPEGMNPNSSTLLGIGITAGGLMLLVAMFLIFNLIRKRIKHLRVVDDLERRAATQEPCRTLNVHYPQYFEHLHEKEAPPVSKRWRMSWLFQQSKRPKPLADAHRPTSTVWIASVETRRHRPVLTGFQKFTLNEVPPPKSTKLQVSNNYNSPTIGIVFSTKAKDDTSIQSSPTEHYPDVALSSQPRKYYSVTSMSRALPKSAKFSPTDSLAGTKDATLHDITLGRAISLRSPVSSVQPPSCPVPPVPKEMEKDAPVPLHQNPKVVRISTTSVETTNSDILLTSPIDKSSSSNGATPITTMIIPSANPSKGKNLETIWQRMLGTKSVMPRKTPANSNKVFQLDGSDGTIRSHQRRVSDLDDMGIERIPTAASATAERMSEQQASSSNSICSTYGINDTHISDKSRGEPYSAQPKTTFTSFNSSPPKRTSTKDFQERREMPVVPSDEYMSELESSSKNHRRPSAVKGSSYENNGQGRYYAARVNSQAPESLGTPTDSSESQSSRLEVEAQSYLDVKSSNVPAESQKARRTSLSHQGSHSPSREHPLVVSDATPWAVATLCLKRHLSKDAISNQSSASAQVMQPSLTQRSPTSLDDSGSGRGNPSMYITSANENRLSPVTPWVLEDRQRSSKAAGDEKWGGDGARPYEQYKPTSPTRVTASDMPGTLNIAPSSHYLYDSLPPDGYLTKTPPLPVRSLARLRTTPQITSGFAISTPPHSPQYAPCPTTSPKDLLGLTPSSPPASPRGPRNEPARSLLRNARALRRMNSEATVNDESEGRRYVRLGRAPSPLLPWSSADPVEHNILDEENELDFATADATTNSRSKPQNGRMPLRLTVPHVQPPSSS